jgi:DNA-binding transcriptional ArsR family regulator
MFASCFFGIIFPPMKLSFDHLERVAGQFRQLAEPTRLAILQELKAGPRSVSAIVAALNTSQANISRHLKQLHDAGLLVRRRDGTQIFYSIGDPMIFDLCRLVCERLNRTAAKPEKIRF